LADNPGVGHRSLVKDGEAHRAPALSHTEAHGIPKGWGHGAHEDATDDEQKTRDGWAKGAKDGARSQVVKESRATKLQGQSACRRQVVSVRNKESFHSMFYQPSVGNPFIYHRDRGIAISHPTYIREDTVFPFLHAI